MMAVVIQDELVFEVPGPWWRWMPLSNPGVATLSVFVIFLGLLDDCLVGPPIGAETVAVKTFHLLLIIFAGQGLGVQRDDRDMAPGVRVAAVGWEGEDNGLIPDLRR
jgi:hypothetical protein